MTDDFHLFADPDDGEGPIDPDLALVSAYLARELSPMQVLALEERLATDSALRERVQPLIDAWSAPVASLEGGLARRVPPLSDMEKAESWRRFQLEEPNDVSTIRRRSSMTRIAAGIALIVLPMATLAQVVVYAANHADVPGHALAQRIVAPFVRGQETRELGTETGRVGANAVAPVPAQQTVSDSPSPSQIWNRVPAGDPGADRVQRVAADLAGPVIATPPQASTVQRAKPDRAKIAALAKQHAPAVVRGDTAADYVLMVLDAADRYVWSTHGIGSLSIEVAGDTRTSEERAEFTREHRAELMGASAARGGGGGVARGGGALDQRRVPDSVRADLARYSAAAGGVARGAGGGGARGSGGGARGGDSVVAAAVYLRELRTQLDTAVAANRRDVRAAGGGGRGARGGGGSADTVRAISGPPGSYRIGGAGMRGGQTITLNQASGLQEPGNGQSGIQGLMSTSVSSGETYTFPAGELAPAMLRVVVVHLRSGTAWKGR